jgi:hypothetical protein
LIDPEAGVPGVACPPKLTPQTTPLVNWHATDTPPPVPGCGVRLLGVASAAGVWVGGEAGPCVGWMPDIAGGRAGGVNMSVLPPLTRTTA